MIKKIVITLLTCSSLFASSMFTLDGIKNLKLNLTNSTYFMSKEEQKSIHDFVKDKLQKAGFKFGEVDPITFMIKVKSIEIDELYVINISVNLAEDVKTNRTNNVEAFAFTYAGSTLIESEDPYEDTLEAIDFLTCQFLTDYKDDNE